MSRRLALALALALGVVGGLASDAAARTVTVRFSHPDPNGTGVTAFRVYLRQAGQSYGAPAWQGLPTPVNGIYTASVTAPDGVTVYATGTAINANGESAFSNEITLAPPAPVCGNGTLESTEQCDDGNAVSGDGCRSTCTVELCGDGIRDAAEQCDDGNTASGDGCRSTCTVERCGDGVRDAAEACDDGNTAGGDGCSATCTVERIPACGDAILDAGEQCDDGNRTNGDGCRSDCTREVCGDARLDPAEQCDDGNLVSGDGCSAQCRLPVCGDGLRDAGEACDDGNTTPGDGCDATCQVEVPVCGDGLVAGAETCDDGNTTSGDGCDASCRIEQSTALPLYVNVGGPDYTDPSGITWRADAPFCRDGSVATSPTPMIAYTTADPLYHSRRYGEITAPPVRCTLPVAEPGLYYVRLHFAETTNEAAYTRPRVFDVLLDGAITIQNVDVINQVGRYQAATRYATVNVTDGQLTLELVPEKGRPMLSGIEVHRASEAPATTASPKSPKIACKRCN